MRKARVHPSLVRFNERLVTSYFDLTSHDAQPKWEDWRRVIRMAWLTAALIKGRRERHVERLGWDDQKHHLRALWYKAGVDPLLPAGLYVESSEQSEEEEGPSRIMPTAKPLEQLKDDCSSLLLPPPSCSPPRLSTTTTTTQLSCSHAAAADKANVFDLEQSLREHSEQQNYAASSPPPPTPSSPPPPTPSSPPPPTPSSPPPPTPSCSTLAQEVLPYLPSYRRSRKLSQSVWEHAFTSLYGEEQEREEEEDGKQGGTVEGKQTKRGGKVDMEGIGGNISSGTAPVYKLKFNKGMLRMRKQGSE
eukprot:GHVS01072467.1.p1 GENE.GHVS01072467.1~~GHVS01072467.1.p1  ORF type:complete len:304 (-),score=104.03 GHVS01072467.1:277-1188(-)